MNIIVCVRQTPDTEAKITIGPDAKSVVTDGLKFVMGPYDEYSHEAAVQMKEKLGGTVTAVSFGPDRVQETLRNCLAIGADEAVHIDAKGVDEDDSLAIATALAAQIKTMPHDLVFTSTKGVDSDRGQVGPMLAELLGVPYAGPASEVEVEDGGRSVLVTRDAEGGREKIRVQLPAVVSAQKGLREPRYASLMNIMKAKKKPISTKTLADLGLDGSIGGKVKVRTEVMEYPPSRPPGRLVDGGTTEEKVRELVRLLREEARIL